MARKISAQLPCLLPGGGGQACFCSPSCDPGPLQDPLFFGGDKHQSPLVAMLKQIAGSHPQSLTQEGWIGAPKSAFLTFPGVAVAGSASTCGEPLPPALEGAEALELSKAGFKI